MNQSIEIAATVERLLDRPIFIAGRGRSGTSLLQRLFDGHPQVFSTQGETRLFTDIVPALRKTGDAETAAVAIALRFPGRGDAPDPDPDLLEQVSALDPSSPTLARELFRIGLERWARRRNPGQAVALLEKTPKNEEHLPVLFDNFPNAKVVYLLRDPRGVYISNRRSDQYRMEPAFLAAQWVKSVRHILKAMLRPEIASRIHVVRFEELVVSPQETAATLCAFLGLDWSDTMTAPTVRGRPWRGNAYAEDKLTPDGVAAHKADEWRSEITPAEEAMILATARAEMTLLGYAGAKGAPQLAEVMSHSAIGSRASISS